MRITWFTTAMLAASAGVFTQANAFSAHHQQHHDSHENNFAQTRVWQQPPGQPNQIAQAKESMKELKQMVE